MEKLIFTNVHFNMNVGLENDNERERKKATTVYGMAQKICPIRQSWGEAVPISFELNFKWAQDKIFLFFFFLHENFLFKISTIEKQLKNALALNTDSLYLQSRNRVAWAVHTQLTFKA